MTCPTCHGEGWIVDCCDDMCHGLGECMHGDNAPCPECGGEGEIWPCPDCRRDSCEGCDVLRETAHDHP